MTELTAEALAGKQDEEQSKVFWLLVDRHPAPMTRAELVTAIGSAREAADGLRPLIEDGIVHERGDLVWPSRAAARLAELIG